MRQVLFVPIIGSGRDEDAFRADLDDADGMVSASIGSILEGDRRGQPTHDWTLVRADLPDRRNTPILRPSGLRDFDEEMPASDKANLPDFVQDKRSYRAVVMEMLGRQYDYTDERMLDLFIQRAVGQSIRGGQNLVAFVEDTFTDTDSTLLQNHTPDTGGSWEALGFQAEGPGEAIVEDAEVVSNRLESTTADRSRGYRNSATPEGVAYTLSMQLHTGNSSTADDLATLLARLSSTGTSNADVDRYIFHAGYWDSSSSARIRKVVNGSTTTLASTNVVTEGLATNTTYDMVFDISDALKEASVTGVFTIDTTDNDVSQIGRAGIGAPANDNGAWVDDFKAEEEPAIEITSVTPSEFLDEETGVTIAGSGFGASQGTGKVELGDDSDYGTATLVEQTVTSWGDTSIDFTVVQGALDSGTVYVFVTNDGGDTTDGFEAHIIHELSATSTGTSTVSAALSTTRSLSAASAGSSEVSAALLAIRQLSAQIDGVSTVSADLVIDEATVELAATIAGQSTVSADLTASFVLSATSAGVSTASADLLAIRNLSVALAGESTVSAELLRTRTLVAAISAQSTVTALLAGGSIVTYVPPGIAQTTKPPSGIAQTTKPPSGIAQTTKPPQPGHARFR